MTLTDFIAVIAIAVQIAFGALGVLFFILAIGSEIEKRRRQRRYADSLDRYTEICKSMPEIKRQRLAECDWTIEDFEKGLRRL